MVSESNQVPIGLESIRYWSSFVGWFFVFFVLWLTRRAGTNWTPTRLGVAFAVPILLVANLWTSGIGRVQPGARGVVLRFGAPTGRTVGEGLYAIVPFIERVVQVNTQVNTVRFDRSQATTLDLEPVYGSLTLAFHVEPGRVVDIYRTLRANYVPRVVRPAVADAWKATIAKFHTSDIIAKRPEVQRVLSEEIRSRIEPFGLKFDSLATDRFQFSYGYSQAAQLRVASEQRTIQARQDIARIKIESQQGVIRARSEVEALKLQRNIPIAQLIHIRQLDLERRAIDKWDGHLPQSTTTMPFLGNTVGGQHSD